MMKKLGLVISRYTSVFFIAVMLLTAVWSVAALLSGQHPVIWPVLYGSLVVSVPGAVVAAAFVSFFSMNRVFASRLAGILAMTVLAGSSLGLLALALRTLPLTLSVDMTILPAGYRTLITWFITAARAEPLQVTAATASVSLLFASSWGCTRVSESRPLLGAFVAPGMALAVMELAALLLTGPADALFAWVGLALPRLFAHAIVLGATAVLFIGLDFLIARKPAGRRRDA